MGGSLVGGLVLGLVWWLVTPLALLEKRDAGVFAVGGRSETAIAADGWFAVCGLVAGAVAALLVALMLRERRLGALLGLAVGGLLGSVVAWRFGVLLGPAPAAESAAAARVGDRFDGPLDLSALGVLLAWPTASVIAFFAAMAGVEPTPARRRWAPGREASADSPDGSRPATRDAEQVSRAE